MIRGKSGFTIVELLIVIVVIAILATISIVAYQGIQQRATNTKIIASANQVVKAISGYIAANGSYPSTGVYCIVPAENSCTAEGNPYLTDTSLTNNLRTISTLPSTVPDIPSSYNGIIYAYFTGSTFNGAPQPLMIFYVLRGNMQQCGMPNVTNTGGGHMVSSTSGYTHNGTSSTVCVISIPGP